MSDLLRTRPASTAEMIEVFSDAAAIADALSFEAALAQAQAAEELVPSEHAEMITRACSEITFDPGDLAEEAALAGTLAIPLLRRLRAALPGPAGATVHLGATSQDVADTVLMMQVVAATRILVRDVRRVVGGLADLAARYASLPAVGRTLLQDAVPVSFGLRFAQSAAAIANGCGRLEAEVAAHACVQLGGAAGTRAGLAGRGNEIAERVAKLLDLRSAAPWHARRGGVAAIASSAGILIGALAKVARDVSLLSQNNIAEAREPLISGRGGSSAMPHKRNPTGCQVALSAALRAPGLVASILCALPQEQERGIGGWQIEAPLIADLFLLAAGSASAMAVVTEGLDIDEAAISRNLHTSGLGSDIGESAVIVAQLLASLS